MYLISRYLLWNVGYNVHKRKIYYIKLIYKEEIMAKLSMDKMISVKRKYNFEITTAIALLMVMIFSSSLSYIEPYFDNVIPVASALLVGTFIRMTTKPRNNNIKLLGVFLSISFISYSLAYVGTSLYDAAGIGVILFCIISALECSVIY